MGPWQPEGKGWISWRRRSCGGAGPDCAGSRCRCVPIPSQGPRGPSGLSHLLRDPSPERTLRSCRDLILPGAGSEQHRSPAKVLPRSLAPCPALLGPSAAAPGPGLVPAPAAKACLLLLERGTFQGFVQEINLQRWVFYPGGTSARAQHLQVGACATFPGRGVSRLEFPAGIPLCRCGKP